MSKSGKIIAIVILLIVVVGSYFFYMQAGTQVKPRIGNNTGKNGDSSGLDPADSSYLKKNLFSGNTGKPGIGSNAGTYI